MFNNVGSKLKAVATVFMYIYLFMICIALVAAVIISLKMGNMTIFFIALGSSAVSLLLIWISCAVIYAIGETHENVMFMQYLTRRSENKPTTSVSTKSSPKTVFSRNSGGRICPECGAFNNTGTNECDICGHKFD